MDTLFPLIPIKLVFVAFAVYFWRKLFIAGNNQNQSRAAKGMLLLAISSIILSVISVGKIYPYGAVTDLLIFASATAIFMTLPKTHPSLRILGGLVLLIPATGPLVYLMHYLVVGGSINKDSFIAVFQTTQSEALEYLATFTSVVSVVAILTFFALVVWVSRPANQATTRTLPLSFAAPMVLLSVLLITIAPLEKGLFTQPFKVYAAYLEEIETSKERLAQFKQRAIEHGFEASKTGQGEIYVVVVGESLNKYHMGIYGYKHNTTPNLTRRQQTGELYVARRSYSNYPGTMSALSHALTEANQKNQKTYLESVGIIDVLNMAGFTTHWLGNQPLSNSYDMILGLIAKQADDVELTFDIEFHSMSHKDHQPDGVLLPLYKQKMADLDPSQNHVIFVHLMGSHTNYCERYPEEYEHFKIPTHQAVWDHIFKGGTGHSRECYDNSILYNDFVLEGLLSELENALGSHGIGGLMYFADHSEDIKRGVGHSTSNFSYEMVESPALFWLSEGFRQQQPELTKHLNDNIDALYANDFVFDTVLGMTKTRVNNSVYCPQCDLFNPDYSLPEDQATTMRGKLPYKPARTDSLRLVTTD